MFVANMNSTNVKMTNLKLLNVVLDVNIAQGEPIIAHYRELGLVSDIQGNQDIDDVFADVKKAIAAIK